MTKPNRDITAETEHTKECVEFMAEDFRRDCICFMKPTTSTEWEKEWKLLFNEVLFRMYNLEIVPEIQSRINERIPGGSGFMMFENQDLEDFIRKLLTTRTNELLGAMKMEKIGQNVILNCVSRNDYKKSYEYCGYNDAVEEFNKKLAALREKYGQR